MMYLANSFSIQMLKISKKTEVIFEPLSKEDARKELDDGFKSVIGHEDTAQVIADDLNMKIEFNREFISIDETDQVIVAQIEGGRLPEGCTTLPEQFSLSYYKVQVKSNREIRCKICGHVAAEEEWVTLRSGSELIKLNPDKKTYLPCPGCGEDVEFEILGGE